MIVGCAAMSNLLAGPRAVCPLLCTPLLPSPRIFASAFFTSSSVNNKNVYHRSSSSNVRRRDVGLGLSHPPHQCLVVRAARTESTAVPLFSRAPPFELPEPLTGKIWKLEDFESHPALLVMFICNHCPFVVHLKADLVRLANEYNPKGLAVVAISSNSVKTHPQDGPQFMAEEAKSLGYPFPYLYDETQEIAKAYGAMCTPDFFLFKKDGTHPFELVYHGQFDDSRPGNNRPITGRDIRNALDCVLSNRPVSTLQKPSIGCSIKWHP